jgi:hypothetical protein
MIAEAVKQNRDFTPEITENTSEKKSKNEEMR